MPSLSPEFLTRWLQPGALVAGAVGGLGLLVNAFGSLRADFKEEMRGTKQELREEMRAGEARVNRRIDEVKDDLKEVKVEMKEMKDEMQEVKSDIREMKGDIQQLKGEMREVKGEIREIKSLLIQALQRSPAARH